MNSAIESPSVNGLPHSEEAERAVLSCCLRDAAALKSARQVLDASAFYIGKHRDLFAAMVAISDSGEELDSATAAVYLEDIGALESHGGPGWIAELLDVGTSPSNVGYHAGIVRSKAGLRAIAERASEIARDARRGDRTTGELLAEITAMAALVPAHDRIASLDDIFGLRCMADVQPRPVSFLFHPYIVKGKLNLLEGRPGRGKTWLALRMAADETRGCGVGYREGGTEDVQEASPGRVLWVGSEDGLEDTIAPRLELMGADQGRIIAMEGERDPKNPEVMHPLTLDQVRKWERIIVELNITLLVIDPLNAFLPRNANTDKDAEIRSVLGPVAKLAERTGCTVIMVRHWKKGASGDPGEAGLGSIGYTGQARSIVAVGNHPDDPDGPRRVMAHVKCNVAEMGRSIEFSLEGGAFRWVGFSEVRGKDLVDQRDRDDHGGGKQAEAESVLRTILLNGPRRSREVQKLAEAEGITPATLRRAKTSMRVESVAERDAIGKTIGWLWSLPEVG